MIARLTVLIVMLLSLACTTNADEGYCENGLFAIDARHDGGDLDKCKFKADDRVELTFRPEDRKVFDAFAWFSFRVTAKETADLHIKLRFPKAYARYWPKVSKDGQDWQRVAEEAVTVSENGKNMHLTVRVDESGTWVSAQELLTQAFYDEWLGELAAHKEMQTTVIGQSVEGRPIHLAKSENKPEVVLLLGRQHPAEVPGALAMRQFINVVLGDSGLAREFRERFTLLIIPMINPDGVANGNSRHNAGRIDLNRDWGPFTQPETQSVAKLMAGIDELGMQPRLMLDFHATKMTDTTLFYTQRAEDVTDPANFASTWLTRVRDRIPDYNFKHDPRPTSEQPNTKGYFYTRYGIPSCTYEIGDEADRELVRMSTPVFAEEMMRTLLEAE